MTITQELQELQKVREEEPTADVSLPVDELEMLYRAAQALAELRGAVFGRGDLGRAAGAAERIIEELGGVDEAAPTPGVMLS